MSTESARKRLEAATPGPWSLVKGGAADRSWHVAEVGRHALECEPGIVGTEDADAELIAHAPTDLRLALDVIGLARTVTDILERHDMHFSGFTAELRAALDAFEAAP